MVVRISLNPPVEQTDSYQLEHGGNPPPDLDADAQERLAALGASAMRWQSECESLGRSLLDVVRVDDANDQAEIGALFELHIERPLFRALAPLAGAGELPEAVLIDAACFLKGDPSDLHWLPLEKRFRETILPLAGIGEAEASDLFGRHWSGCKLGAAFEALGRRLISKGFLVACGVSAGKVVQLPPEWFARADVPFRGVSDGWKRVRACSPVILTSARDAMRLKESYPPDRDPRPPRALAGRASPHPSAGSAPITFVPGRRLRLDDDGYAILGNALLAAWFSRLHWARQPEGRELRFEAGERMELRDLLDFHGVLDDAFAGPYRASGDYPLETLAEFEERLDTALNGTAPFARLSLGMIDLADHSGLSEGLIAALETLAPGELRTPIARLGPCLITRELRRLVMDYFRGALPQSSEGKGNSVALGGPRTGHGIAREGLAAKRLADWSGRCPDARMSRADLVQAAMKAGFSRKAAGRIWNAGAPNSWKGPGKIPATVTRPTVAEMAKILEV